MDERKIVKEFSIHNHNNKYLRKVAQEGKIKLTSEQTQRNYLLELARAQGSEGELIKLFNKYDRLLNNCTNPVERSHISVLGISEIHKLLNCSDELLVNGISILPSVKQIKE